MAYIHFREIVFLLRVYLIWFIWNTSCSQDNTRKSYNDLFPVWSIDDVWGFRVGGGVHDSYTFQCGLVGYFYFPWHRHQIEGTDGFYCLVRKTLASGVNGIAKVPKRKVFTEVGLEPSNVRSPVESLTHLATAPSLVIVSQFDLTKSTAGTDLNWCGWTDYERRCVQHRCPEHLGFRLWELFQYYELSTLPRNLRNGKKVRIINVSHLSTWPHPRKLRKIGDTARLFYFTIINFTKYILFNGHWIRRLLKPNTWPVYFQQHRSGSGYYWERGILLNVNI